MRPDIRLNAISGGRAGRELFHSRGKGDTSKVRQVTTQKLSRQPTNDVHGSQYVQYVPLTLVPISYPQVLISNPPCMTSIPYAIFFCCLFLKILMSLSRESDIK